MAHPAAFAWHDCRRLSAVGVLAVATVLVLGTAPQSSPAAPEAGFGWFPADPGLDPFATDPYRMDPYTTDPYSSGFGQTEALSKPDTSGYADLYQGGDPVTPHAADDPEYDEQFDAVAHSCFHGAVGSLTTSSTRPGWARSTTDTARPAPAGSTG